MITEELSDEGHRQIHARRLQPRAGVHRYLARGKGVWGPVPMPASDSKKISDEDLNAVIAWILKQ